jgi:hypothetical protein
VLIAIESLGPGAENRSRAHHCAPPKKAAHSLVGDAPSVIMGGGECLCRRQKSMDVRIVHNLLEEIAPGVWVEHIYNGQPIWIVVEATTLGGTSRRLHLVRDAVCQYAEDGLSPEVVSRLCSDPGVQWLMEENDQ